MKAMLKMNFGGHFTVSNFKKQYITMTVVFLTNFLNAIFNVQLISKDDYSMCEGNNSFLRSFRVFLRLLGNYFDVPFLILGLTILSIKSSNNVLFGMKKIESLIKVSRFHRLKERRETIVTNE